jgi:hypothetical protein
MSKTRPLTIVLAALTLCAASFASSASADFGFKPGSAGLSSNATIEGDAPAKLAGTHPYELTTDFNFNLGPGSPGEPGVPFSEGDVKDLEIALPAGLIENPAAVVQCTLAEFNTLRESPFEEPSRAGENCTQRSQIGTVSVRSSFNGGETRTFGLFNLVPPVGAPSAIGFNAYGAPVIFVPRVRQVDGEYGLTLRAADIPQVLNLNGFTLTVWGNPWGASHNYQRGNCLNEAEPEFGWAKCQVGPPRVNQQIAYLTLPTACDAPLVTTATADSWQEPQRKVSRSYETPALEGCSGLAFAPVTTARVANPRASSPSGFDFELDADETGFLSPAFRASSPVKTAVVGLTEGMTINPSVGAGLGVCTPAQYAAETVTSSLEEGCAQDSKIGDFTVHSPLFEGAVEGSLYLAAPHDNPFGTLLAIYLVAKSPQRGILVKVAGKLDANPDTGQLTATFENLPQLPYTDLRVHFREGQRSPLATPPACGSYNTQLALTPWRSPGTVVRNTWPFSITSGSGGGPCPSGTPPFSPMATGGTINSAAAAYSPFYLHIRRQDTEQEITSYSTTLPPGLTGKLAGIPYCPESAIAAAKASSGFAETAHPSCPAASSIGHTVSGFGLGAVLSYAPGGLYLAGPFHGAPFSIVALDAATVGPFDLGTIVVRSAIKIDPQTAQVSIDAAGSDPIPHIIDGIPIHLADVRAYIDRSGFTLNPTNCSPFSVASALNGSGLRFGDPSDDSLARPSSPFQAFDCSSLGFGPQLSLRLKGGGKRGNYPSLHAVVTPRPGDANIGRAKVALPPTEFLAQNHIETICTNSQFAREACPGASVYGRARAYTPLLSQPLEGKVYLRSSKNSLPDLVAALRGGGNDIAIDVVGKIDSVQGGLRGTFDTLPDAPVSRFEMTLFGGKRGLLVNAGNICKAKQSADALMVGANNLGRQWSPAIKVKCGKKGRGGKKKKGGKK